MALDAIRRRFHGWDMTIDLDHPVSLGTVGVFPVRFQWEVIILITAFDRSGFGVVLRRRRLEAEVCRLKPLVHVRDAFEHVICFLPHEVGMSA